MLKAAKAYLSTQVSTASKGDLLLMLYDTAIKHLKLAVEKMAEKDFAAKGILISKAIAIISELQESLNKEQGGDVTKNLFQLYFICNTKLLSANIQMNPALVEEVIGILGGLRQAFAQIIPMHEGGSTMAGNAPFTAGTPGTSVAKPAQATAPAAQATAAVPAAPTTPAVPDSTPQAQGNAPQDTPQQASPAQPEPAPAQPVQPTPVQTVRFRAANAYANSR